MLVIVIHLKYTFILQSLNFQMLTKRDHNLHLLCALAIILEPNNW